MSHREHLVRPALAGFGLDLAGMVSADRPYGRAAAAERPDVEPAWRTGGRRPAMCIVLPVRRAWPTVGLVVLALSGCGGGDVPVPGSAFRPPKTTGERVRRKTTISPAGERTNGGASRRMLLDSRDRLLGQDDTAKVFEAQDAVVKALWSDRWDVAIARAEEAASLLTRGEGPAPPTR